MLNLLFNPSGRINKGQFTKAVLILVALALLLAVPQFLGAPDSIVMLIGILAMVLYYPWVVIWIKRYHDAGKPGAMCLIPIIIYVIALTIMMGVVMGAEYMEIIKASVDGATPQETTEMTEAMMENKLLPMTIGSVVVTLLIALGFNAIIRHDDHENQFGPES